MTSSPPLPDILDSKKLEENKNILNPLKSTQTTQGSFNFIEYFT